MWSIYSFTPAPWGNAYRFVEAFDTEEDAEEVLAILETVNILFNCYKIVKEDYVQTNKHLRAENKRLKKRIEEAIDRIATVSLAFASNTNVSCERYELSDIIKVLRGK